MSNERYTGPSQFYLEVLLDPDRINHKSKINHFDRKPYHTMSGRNLMKVYKKEVDNNDRKDEAK